MSQAGGPSGGELGRAYVTFTGDTAPLEAATAKAVETTKAGASEAQKAATSSAAEQAQASTTVAEGHEKAADAAEKGAEKQTRSAQKIRTALMAVLGGVAALVGLVGRLNDLFDDTRAAKFIRSIDPKDAMGGLKRLNEELVQLQIQQSKIDALSGVKNWAQNLDGQIAALEAYQVVLKKTAEANAAEEVRRAKETAEREAEARSAALDKRIKTETAKTLEGEERIRYEAQVTLDELNAAYASASREEQKRIIDLSKIIENRRDKEVSDYRKGEEEKRTEKQKTVDEGVKRAEDAARREAAAFERAFSRAMSSIQQQSAQLFTGDQVTAQLERVASLLEDIADQRAGMRGRD